MPGGLAQRALTVAVLALTLTITFVLWRHEQTKINEARQAALDSSLRESSALVQQRLAAYEQTLRGFQGLFATDDIDRADVKADVATYVRALDLGADFSGLEALGWAAVAAGADGSAGTRAPIVQIEPAPASTAALGFDPFNDPQRRAAMEQARDTGALAITGKIDRLRELGDKAQPGFVLYLPLYRQPPAADTPPARRAALAGWVFAPLRMQGVMDTLYGNAKGATALRIFDGIDTSPRALMYDEVAQDAQGGAPAPLRTRNPQTAYEYIEIAGHTWTLAMQPLAGAGQGVNSDASRTIGVAGVTLGLLLSALTWQLTTARARATAVAQEMTVELRQLATTDFLTGLANRRHFTGRLADELARQQRAASHQASLLMLDLDHFKRVNDSHGHPAGDAVLQHFAALATAELRKIDLAGRVGGEEFAILLSGADARAALAFAERLRSRLSRTPLIWQGRPIVVTVSIGIAPMGGADSTPDAVMVRADQALYRAKAAGRDRVVLAAAADSEPMASSA